MTAAPEEGWGSRFGVTLSLALLSVPARAADQGLALRETAARFDRANQAVNDVSDTRLRPFVRIGGGDWAVRFEPEATMIFSSAEAAVFAPRSLPERWDMTWEDHAAGRTTRVRVERLDLWARAGSLDVDVGRQPVGFGTSHYVSVADFVAPFAPGDLDAAYKPGVDALRVRRGLGESGEVEAMGIGAPSEVGPGALLRGRISPGGWDWETVAGRYRKRNLATLAWDGPLSDWGLWGEGILFDRREGDPGGGSGSALSALAGLDGAPIQGWRTGLAALHQSMGAAQPEDYLATAAAGPWAEGWTYLLARSYAVLTVDRTFHPLVTGNLAVLLNAVDGSTLWQPRLTLSLSDEADLTLYGWLGTGSPFPATEFGSTVSTGLYLRWYL